MAHVEESQNAPSLLNKVSLGVREMLRKFDAVLKGDLSGVSALQKDLELNRSKTSDLLRHILMSDLDSQI